MAQNPITGSPIKILRSEASLWRNRKTVVWLKDQQDHPWDRFDTVCVGSKDTQKWLNEKKRIDFVILTDTDQETLFWFLQMNTKAHRMIFITRAFVVAVGEQTFRSLKLTNVVCLDELHLMYPFLGPQWDASIEDALLMAAALLRYCILAGVTKRPQARLDAFKANEISLIFENAKPPKPLWFLTQYYKSDKSQRQAELKKCLEMNVQCPHIDKIVLLNEKDYSKDFPVSKTKKIEQHIVGQRSTYKMLLQFIKDKVPEGVLCVFANADIFLDAGDSWRDLWSVDMVDQFLALLRYDVQKTGDSKLFGPRNDSQDTWCVLSDSVKNSKKVWDWPELDFPFGKAGCDNAITVEMMKRKFTVSNPALSLKTHHLQISDYRTYNKLDVVDKPSYLYVDPTGIHDMKPVYDLSKFDCGKRVASAFKRQLRAVQPRVLDTYCKMLEREERFKFGKNDTNLVVAEELGFTKYTNAFHTPSGLVYGYNRLFIGKAESSKEAWSKSELSPVVPTIRVKKALVAPYLDAFTNTTEGYLLYYIAKILVLRKEFGDGEFWTSTGDSTKGLELFQWNRHDVPVLPRSENAQVWFEEAYQYPFLSTQELRREELQALRAFSKCTWEPVPTGQTWVVIVDGKYITNEMASAYESTYSDKIWTCIYEGRTNPQVTVEKLTGAAGVILYGGSKAISRWGYLWALPKSACVIEVQNEMDPNGDVAHFAGAADLAYHYISIPRANDFHTRQMIDKQIARTFDSFNVKETLPVIRMPKKTGFFAHAGDSFREMVLLWEEKGYVKVQDDPTVTQIWLGDVLLYDRPTLDWLFAAPEAEQKWSLALFGNPKPSTSGGPAQPWFFWPRRPRLVEALVSQTFERTKTLVFYGKIENKVQERRRKGHDWASVCDEFQMVTGEQPYTLTQEEYLRKLAQAKYGLCLAGFGKKCHREVECMALGTVPIVTADVDMESYANPPIEGTHFFRCLTPEDVRSTLASTTEAKWSEMSQACKDWWRENASAEGSWLLTKKLIKL